ncbi:MAG: aldehyde dehydrogenase family protein [Deltaproteobacteria bacterium]|nr:aldehyde dehydrogenase family protein [Deltaproteobacteria bacterium]
METRLLINGQWQEGQGKSLPVHNPYDWSIIDEVKEAESGEIEDAIAGALIGAKLMAGLPAYKRSALLDRAAELIEQDKEDLAGLIARESGKTIRYARVEVNRAVSIFKLAAEESKRIYGEVIPMDVAAQSKGRFAFTYRYPLGVILAISPFNFPLNLVAHKVAPALAAGNAVIIKPASVTPLSAIRLGQLLMDAGAPIGSVSIITGSGGEAGQALVKDNRPAMVTFTGSPEVGQLIRNTAGMKRVTLEMGANCALIIDKGMDLSRVYPRCVMGAFYNSGQVCISVQNIYVHNSIKEEFVAGLLAATEKQVVGDQMLEETDVGPMISEAEAKRAESWVNQAVAGGGRILTGGKREFTLFYPTIIDEPPLDSNVVCKEVFAPVVSVIGFDQLDQALDLVNSSPYGLQAGIFTNDLAAAFKAFQTLQVGSVMINDVPTFRADHMPYGGIKKSGQGREGVRYAIEEMTETKLVVWNLG